MDALPRLLVEACFLVAFGAVLAHGAAWQEAVRWAAGASLAACLTLHARFTALVHILFLYLYLCGRTPETMALTLATALWPSVEWDGVVVYLCLWTSFEYAWVVCRRATAADTPWFVASQVAMYAFTGIWTVRFASSAHAAPLDLLMHVASAGMFYTGYRVRDCMGLVAGARTGRLAADV